MIIGSQQELLDYIAKDLEKNKGICYPLKAGRLERFFKRKVNVAKLHPNPDDEFSMPEFGPSFRIVNEYRKAIRDSYDSYSNIFDERIVIEKIAPSGYMIINGHHRWSAAMLERVKKVRCEVVNLTHDEDIHHIIDNSTRNKRVAIDFDEVILSSKGKEDVEKSSSLIEKLFYRDKIKIGRAALINTLHKMGYDVWVYTRGYRSTDYIQGLFRCYNFKVDGIINGVGKRNPEQEAAIREKCDKKYLLSLHIDNDQVTYVDKETRDFFNFQVVCDHEEDWSKKVLEIIENVEGD